jgi:hypothetical protein
VSNSSSYSSLGRDSVSIATLAVSVDADWMSSGAKNPTFPTLGNALEETAVGRNNAASWTLEEGVGFGGNVRKSSTLEERVGVGEGGVENAVGVGDRNAATGCIQGAGS